MTLRRQIHVEMELAKAGKAAREQRIRQAHQRFKEGLTNEPEDARVQPYKPNEKPPLRWPRKTHVWHITK